MRIRPIHFVPDLAEAVAVLRGARLVLSAPSTAGGGGQAMPDGTTPTPGGWNRFMLEIRDLATTVTALREAGVPFRNDIVTGVGGTQILLNDPSVATQSNCSNRRGPRRPSPPANDRSALTTAERRMLTAAEPLEGYRPS